MGLGGTVELNELSFRVFEVRTEDTVYSIPGPGEPPVSRVSSSDGSDEYVAIDYVVENDSDSVATQEMRPGSQPWCMPRVGWRGSGSPNYRGLARLSRPDSAAVAPGY